MHEEDRELGGLFLPYFETPGQYADARRRSSGWEPERRLFAAAFESHIYDCLYLPVIAGTDHNRRLRWQYHAIEWLKSDSEEPLSFRWYCEVLGYEWTWVRKQVLEGKLAKRGRAEPR